MNTILRPPPLPIIGWGNDDAWLQKRNAGISASDVAAILGFSRYASPWEVWAEKTGLRPRTVDSTKEAIRLGVALEPWLIVQARHHLGVPVVHTDARLYAHHDTPWQLASPDAEARPDDGEPFGVEAKTAGLGGGFGVPKGWDDDQIPLGYQLQAHWQMRVMGWRKVVVVALVAGLGLRYYTILRDLQTELDLNDQVTNWYERHIIGGVEPAMCARDANLLDDIWPDKNEGHLQLDDNPNIVELVLDYQAGIAEEKTGADRKKKAEAQIRRIMGAHCAGTLDGKEIIGWKTRRGNVRWRDYLEDIYTTGGWDPDDIDSDTEPYRAAPTQSITVKGIKK